MGLFCELFKLSIMDFKLLDSIKGEVKNLAKKKQKGIVLFFAIC